MIEKQIGERKMKHTERIDLVCPIHGGPWTPDNRCCEQAVETKQSRARRQRNATRRAINDAMRGMGLVRVRGALGGIYWE